MSKRSEERALEVYPYYTAENLDDVIKARKFFAKGYEQAEKDLGWHSVKESLPPMDTRQLYTLLVPQHDCNSEQKPAEWSKEDEDITNGWSGADLERYLSCLQRLGTGNPQQPGTINSKWFKEHCRPQPKQEWSEEDKKAIERAIDCVRAWEIDYCDGDNTISERLKSLRPQSKQDWGEEDEKMLQTLIHDLGVIYEKVYPDNVNLKKELNWLNSFRPRPHWKPTKGMLDALEWAKCEFYPDCLKTMKQLQYLYSELKSIYYDGD